MSTKSKKRPKVSVLMCVFNGGRPLYSALESILLQTYKDFEVVIVDDGSTDETPAILNEFATRDSRILIVHQKNQGLTRALNVGIAASNGEYIARQDADDLSHPERLQMQVAAMSSDESIVLVGSDFDVIDDDGHHIVDIRNSRKKNLNSSLVKSNPFAHGCIMFRKEINGDPVLYDEFYYKAQDRDLIFRLSELGRLYTVPEILYSWRFSRKGILATNVTFFGTRAVENYLRRKDGSQENFTPPTEDQVRENPSEAHLQMALGVRLLSGYRTRESRKALLKAAKLYGINKPEFRQAVKMIIATYIPVPILILIRER